MAIKAAACIGLLGHLDEAVSMADTVRGDLCMDMLTRLHVIPTFWPSALSVSIGSAGLTSSL